MKIPYVNTVVLINLLGKMYKVRRFCMGVKDFLIAFIIYLDITFRTLYVLAYLSHLQS